MPTKQESQPAPNVVLGTAGHIDHGKSSLVRALTGTDPDRLAEEKKRGITIELGFAQLKPPDGTAMGVVDVPGHEHFVRQMIAGSTGIDLALLVIAADDGIMPQTIEHLAVLRTLGVKTLVVALTKTDLVDEEWIAFVSGEIRTWLADTPYANADIVPCSSRTGAGLDELLRALQKAAARTGHSKFGRQLRLPIDRVFTIRGAGTVVTGTLWSGTARPGDLAEVLPGSLTSRIRSVQMHGQPVDAAPAGNRVALNLPDLKKEQIHPGDFLAAPDSLQPTDRFDARVTFIDTAGQGKPLPSGTRMHIAHGTREVQGRVLFMDGLKELASGQSAFAQIRLEEPLPVSAGDRFVIRTWSPVSVAGGGCVLLSYPRRRTRLTPNERELLQASESGDLQTAAIDAVKAQAQPVGAAAVARAIGTEREPVRRMLEEAVENRKLVRLGEAGSAEATFATKSLRQRYVAGIERALVAFHAAHPGQAGLPKARLAQQVAPHLEATAFEALLDEAVHDGKAIVVGGQVGHPASQGAARKAQEQEAQTLLGALQAGGAAPTMPPKLFDEAGLGAKTGQHALTTLVRDGRAVHIDGDLYLAADALECCKQAVCAHLETGGAGTVAALKDAMGTSRRYAVPLLESFDTQGVTVRSGDIRSLSGR